MEREILREKESDCEQARANRIDKQSQRRKGSNYSSNQIDALQPGVNTRVIPGRTWPSVVA